MAHDIMGMKLWSMGALWLVLDVLTHPTHAFLASPMAHLSVQTRPAFSSSLLPGHARSRAASSPARSRAAAISVLASARAETVGDILIVGGGPSGLGAALELDTVMNKELRDQWGGAKITVCEKMAPISTYDPNKGFMYLVSELGLKFTDRHGLSETVAAEGVDGKTLNGNRVGIDGKRTKFTFSFGKIRTPYWLPRDGFVSILEKAARERTRVDLREGWEVTSIRRVGQGADLAVEATLRGPDGQEETMRPFLLVGADGLKSVVRASLCEWAQADGGDQTDRFDMLQQPSPAGGLRYKVLKLNPTFPLPPAPGSWQEAAADETGLAAPGGGDTIEAEQSYSFLSRYQGSWRDKNKETRLGLLPLKAKYAYRTANVITWPDHDLWTDPALATPEGMQQFLRDSFPQVPWDLAVTKEELARFAASPGGRFPQPQTTKGGAVWASGATGVVLVGDALHAFPPDLGQGVNSALKDVAALGDALRNFSVSSPGASGAYTMGPTEGNCREQLEPALGMYEAEATGEAKALVRMMQLGSPYQYSQPGFRAQVAAKLMAANLILRLVLSKLPILGARSPRPIFFPQISMLSQLSGDVSYREMLARAHRTTWAFAALGVATALAAAKAFLIKLAVWHTASFWGQIAMWVCLFKALGL